MINRLNFAKTKAFFQADIAANQYETYLQKQEKQEDLNELLDDYNAQMREDVERAGDFSFWGSIVGTAVGCIWGPMGCYAGYQIGKGGGKFLADVTDSEEEILGIQKQIDDFDFNLDRLGSKYDALKDMEWEDRMEASADKVADDIGLWADEYYDPWYKDLFWDVAVPVGQVYLSTGGFKGLDKADSLYGGEFVSSLQNMVRDPSKKIGSEYYDSTTGKYEWENN
jgi:hypothetical protein